MTFSWTYLINVTLLGTATTNGCINNGLITFTDTPARNSNSLSAPHCISKTPGPNNQHSVPRLRRGRFRAKPRAKKGAELSWSGGYGGRGCERETFVTNQGKWKGIDLPAIARSSYLCKTRGGRGN